MPGSSCVAVSGPSPTPKRIFTTIHGSDAAYACCARGGDDRMVRVAERITFPSSSGPALAGLIDQPEGECRGWGVFVHGFTLGKDSPAAS